MNKIIINILKKLNKNGFLAYVVGGYVRDKILNVDTYDIDICTNALPKDIISILKLDKATIDNYGCVNIKTQKYNIDITTFREEKNYQDRRPKEINYVDDLSIDLKRRDFTINAICYDGKDLIDEYNGIDDLNNRVIKMIGDPMIRFEEDALRMLRALRFSSSLGFKIDENICKAINEKCYLIDNLTNSVKKRELDSIEKGKYYKEFLNRYGDIFNRVFDKKTKGGY